MTMAQQPYGDIDPFEMAAYIKDGYRIPQPIHCPDELWVQDLSYNPPWPINSHTFKKM